MAFLGKTENFVTQKLKSKHCFLSFFLEIERKIFTHIPGLRSKCLMVISRKLVLILNTGNLFWRFSALSCDFEKNRIGNTDLIDPELGAEESATSFDRKLNNWSKSTWSVEEFCPNCDVSRSLSFGLSCSANRLSFLISSSASLKIKINNK